MILNMFSKRGQRNINTEIPCTRPLCAHPQFEELISGTFYNRKKILATKIERETEREREGEEGEMKIHLVWSELDWIGAVGAILKAKRRFGWLSRHLEWERKREGKKTQIPIHRAVKISHKWQVEDKHYQRLFLEGWLSILISQIDLFIKIRW